MYLLLLLLFKGGGSGSCCCCCIVALIMLIVGIAEVMIIIVDYWHSCAVRQRDGQWGQAEADWVPITRRRLLLLWRCRRNDSVLRISMLIHDMVLKIRRHHAAK